MGGSGGGYFNSDINRLKAKMNDTTKKIAADEYESNVACFLSELLSQYNDRDTEKINTHLDEILKAIENRIDSSLNILLGGSVSKHTYVDGISDIDALIIINDSKLQNKNPETIKNDIYDMLKERFPNTTITTGNIAVTVSFVDCYIQILPALKNGAKIMIPDSSGKNWSRIDTKKFTQALTETNANNGNKVVPVIKLIKAIISKFPEKQRLSGYHVESLAVDIFNNYHGNCNVKSMMKYFFQEASKNVLSPIHDRTGQSIHVDEYLGERDGLLRQLVSSALDRICRKLQNADKSQSIEIWKDVLK